MKKSFAKLILSLLSAQLIMSSISPIVQAVNTDENEVTQPLDPEESELDESIPEESLPIESEPDYSYPDYSYPDYEEPVYIEPPTDQEAIQITPDEEEEPVVLDMNSVHVQTLVETSLFNPQMRLAIEDYIYIIENYVLEDRLFDDMMGSTLEEIESTFLGNAIPVVNRDDEGLITLSLEYPVLETEEDEVSEEIVESIPAKIVLYFDDFDFLIGSGLYQAQTDNLPYNAIDAEYGQSLIDADISELYFEGLYYSSIFQAKANDQVFTALSTPSLTEGAEEVFITDFYSVFSHETHTEEVEANYSDFLPYYLNGFMNQWYELELPTEAPQTEVSNEEEASEESSTEELSEEESLEESLEESEDPSESGTDFSDRYSLGEEYEGEQLPANVIEAGYQTLTSRVIKGELKQSREDIVNIMGEPTLTQETDGIELLTYYGKNPDLVILLTVQLTDNDQILKVRYEKLTPKVEEVFPLTLEELFAFTEEKDLTFFNLTSLLGDPTIIEHEFNAGETIAYFWTSYVDEEIQTIEAEKEAASTKINLYYYDPEN